MLHFGKEAKRLHISADLALEHMRSPAKGQTGFLSIGFNELPRCKAYGIAGGIESSLRGHLCLMAERQTMSVPSIS